MQAGRQCLCFWQRARQYLLYPLLVQAGPMVKIESVCCHAKKPEITSVSVRLERSELLLLVEYQHGLLGLLQRGLTGLQQLHAFSVGG